MVPIVIVCLSLFGLGGEETVTMHAVEMWVAHSAHKVMEQECKPVGAQPEIHIGAARNESESAQLVISASRPLKNFRVEVGMEVSKKHGTAPQAATAGANA